jgi:hypothetical protein
MTVNFVGYSLLVLAIFSALSSVYFTFVRKNEVFARNFTVAGGSTAFVAIALFAGSMFNITVTW